jgi:hypothetical protein
LDDVLTERVELRIVILAGGQVPGIQNHTRI